jgi:hypothetical protein
MKASMAKFPLVLLLSFGLVSAAGAADKNKDKDTIKSLDKKSVEVRPGKLIVNSSDKARENYRAFLDLVSDDPDLRAEAMRRLADLELEASEALQLRDNIDALDVVAYESATTLFHQLLARARTRTGSRA